MIMLIFPPQVFFSAGYNSFYDCSRFITALYRKIRNTAIQEGQEPKVLVSEPGQNFVPKGPLCQMLPS